jgi:hypothetical protein
MTPHRRTVSKSALPTLLLAAALLFAAGPARAERLDSREEIAAERPEAWAMRFFAAATQSTGFGVPERRGLGAIDLGAEIGSLPRLSERERTVGFDGTKTEDLNRAPAIVRPRLAVGIGGGFSLVADYVPPVEMDGIKPEVVSLAIERPLWESGRWRLGARLGAGSGNLEGDITCTRKEAAAGDDPIANPFGCESASHDAQRFHWKNAEVELGHVFAGAPALEAHLAVSAWRLDGVFRVDADYSGIEDYSRLAYHGTDWGVATGITWRRGPAWRFAGELFYAPLDVVRDPFGDGKKTTDAFWNLRLAIHYRLR